MLKYFLPRFLIPYRILHPIRIKRKYSLNTATALATRFSFLIWIVACMCVLEVLSDLGFLKSKRSHCFDSGFQYSCLINVLERCIVLNLITILITNLKCMSTSLLTLWSAVWSPERKYGSSSARIWLMAAS